MNKTAVCVSNGSFLPRQTLQHLSFRTICSDSVQSSSGHGSLGTSRCMVLSCDGQKRKPSGAPPHVPCSSAKSLEVITKVIIHLFSFLSSFQSPVVCSSQTNYSFITRWFCLNYSLSSKKKMKASLSLFPPAVFCDLS